MLITATTVRCGVICVAVCLPAGCSRQGNVDSPTQHPNPQSSPSAPTGQHAPIENKVAVSQSPLDSDALFLAEVTEELGLPATTTPWPDGKLFTPEITPGGIALLDYDNDGDLDIYQICHPPCGSPPNPFSGQSPNRLFRQEQNGTFVEVADAGGLNDPGFGHGVAVGDCDNDGDLDVYVTNYGPDSLYRNEGDGSFTNITSIAGITGDYWSSAASFFDYDCDGDLDLYVVNFATYDTSKRCSPSGDNDDLDYCGPHEFPGLRDCLYRNEGDGTFTNVAGEVGITTAARGWGVITADITGNGWPDIYVANDEEPNQLWVRQENGDYIDEAIFRGVAFNSDGNTEASMGVAFGDVNGDERMDLFMTHVTLETNTLYLAEGDVSDSNFSDASNLSGMSLVDMPYTGWGCAFLDLDHDGDLDLVVANGRVSKGIVAPGAKLSPFWSRYGEANFLFENDGTGRFAKVGERAGAYGTHVEVTRGLAIGDLDSDGDYDIVTNNLDNTLRVFRNDAPKPATHWLLVRALIGKRDAIGAKLTLKVGGRRRVAVVLPSYSYLASNDPRVHFGLGSSTLVERLEVTWPDGTSEAFDVPEVDQVLTITQGSGRSTR